MAALALPPVLTQVHIVLLMASEARRIQLDLTRGLLVTAGADQFRVRPGECESRLLAVIELPDRPAVG